MNTEQTYLYKFLRTGMKSQNGECVWEIGKWKHEDAISLCDYGFHASVRTIDALSYVSGEILAQVEVKGKHLSQSDKQVWTDMRVVKAWQWTKTDSVALSIFAAELVIDHFEKVYPEDKRPRQAIEAAKAYLNSPSEAARAVRAVRAARAARAAEAAAEAARAARAAWAAEAAAKAARAARAARAAEAAARAAEAAAWAARAAARAAEAAAWAAAKQSILDQINDWMIARISALEEIK